MTPPFGIGPSDTILYLPEPEINPDEIRTLIRIWGLPDSILRETDETEIPEDFDPDRTYFLIYKNLSLTPNHPDPFPGHIWTLGRESDGKMIDIDPRTGKILGSTYSEEYWTLDGNPIMISLRDDFTLST